jgi:hypothetical protein
MCPQTPRFARVTVHRSGYETGRVIGVGIERRIEVDEIYRFILDVFAKDLKIIAVLERVHVLH